MRSCSSANPKIEKATRATGVAIRMRPKSKWRERRSQSLPRHRKSFYTLARTSMDPSQISSVFEKSPRRRAVWLSYSQGEK
jgi:hypothetical protein